MQQVAASVHGTALAPDQPLRDARTSAAIHTKAGSSGSGLQSRCTSRAG